MADDRTYADKKREAQQHLIKLGYADTFEAHNAPGLTDNTKFSIALAKFRADNGLRSGTGFDTALELMNQKAQALDAKAGPAQTAEKPAAPKPEAPKPEAASSSPGKTAFAHAARYDPQVAEAQAYLRILGYNGQNGKLDVGPIDGNRGPKETSNTLTNAALAQFSKENKLPKDATMADIVRALKEKALSGPGLARMEDMMGKSAIGVKSQDVKAVQMALKANGAGGVAATGFPDKNSNDRAALAALKAKRPDSAPQANEGAAPSAPAEQPEIHVAPGGETQGIAPQEGVIPTVVVDSTPVPEPSAPPPVQAAPVETPATYNPAPVPPPMPAMPAAAALPEETGASAPAASMQVQSAPAAAPNPAPAPPPMSEAAAPQRYRVVGSRERELSTPDHGTFSRVSRRPEPGPIQQANMGVREVTRTINQTAGTVYGLLNAITRLRR